MKSSSGAHYLALDHVRAIAAFLVVVWHFTHAFHGYPIPFEYVPTVFPFALLDEGHTGVALFMTLSGYLFAKLLDGKVISYARFLRNRALRLLPLLVIVILVVGLQTWINGGDVAKYAVSVAKGVLFPTLPNGGWSITAEAHYYAALPLLLWLVRKSRFLPLLIVAAAIALRFLLHHERGEVQSLAYYTVVGRIDQFAAGMIVYQFRHYIARRHVMALLIAVGISLVYWVFDSSGGFYLAPSYPSPSRVWIVLPTLEGIAYACLIAWYDNSFAFKKSGFSRLVGHLGEYSYSIYLLHVFVVFDTARFVHERVMDLSNFYVACVWATLFFATMIVPGYFSFRFIERPFLRLRTRYIKNDETDKESHGTGALAVKPRSTPS